MDSRLQSVPRFIRSDNGPEFIAEAIKRWLAKNQVRLRDELLDREVFYSLKVAEVIVESWRLEYNHYWLNSGLGYMTPVAFTAKCIALALPTAHPQQYIEQNVGNSLIKVGT